MEQRVSLVTLGVRDIEKSRSFYEALGWKRGNTHAEVAFFQAGGMVVALWDRKELAKDAGVSDTGAEFSGMALAYNTRSREQADQVLAEAERAGGRILKPGTETPWGGYSGYFSDPDGHLWEVAWNPEWFLSDDGRVTLPYKA
ncbi:MAG: VOC family protein [Parvibaculaceae bacterium]